MREWWLVIDSPTKRDQVFNSAYEARCWFDEFGGELVHVIADVLI